MELPKQIQQHIDEVDALEKQMTGVNEAPEPVVEQDSAPANVIEDAAQAPIEQTAPPPENEVDEEAEAKWEHKYKRLQGKYNAEVPRLHQELKAVRGQFEQVNSLYAELQSKADAKPAETPRGHVTDEDIETYGEELIDLQRRIVREASESFQGEIDKLRAENSYLQSQMGQVTTNSFDMRLNSAIPDFQIVNADPAWIEWLDGYDPMLRAPRRVAAQTAFDNQDIDAIASYVEMFQENNPAPQNSREKRQAELQRQVQPSRATATVNGGTQQRIYSQADVEKGYGKIQQYLARGQFDKANDLDNEYSTAYSEGRVRA